MSSYYMQQVRRLAQQKYVTDRSLERLATRTGDILTKAPTVITRPPTRIVLPSGQITTPRGRPTPIPPAAEIAAQRIKQIQAQITPPPVTPVTPPPTPPIQQAVTPPTPLPPPTPPQVIQPPQPIQQTVTPKQEKFISMIPPVILRMIPFMSRAAQRVGFGVDIPLIWPWGGDKQQLPQVKRRRTVDIAVDLATGNLVIVPTARKKRRARGRRLTQVEREVLRSQADFTKIASMAMLTNVLSSHGGGACK